VTEPASRPLLSRRDSTVDGLRGVAVMLVVLRHVLRSDVFGMHWFHSLQLGSMGVQLFFVISGFVIGALLSEAPPDPRTLGRFMARRLVRLSPPYYAAIALALVLFQLYGRVNPTGSYLRAAARSSAVLARVRLLSAATCRSISTSAGRSRSRCSST
jgi:peptidoglycan/LPS O-acetylase OafA/YrhL